MTLAECAEDQSTRTYNLDRTALISYPMPGAARTLLAWLDRHRFGFFAVLVGILLLGFNGQWQVEPDSALYLALAHSISLGGGYSYHGSPHHLVYPGLPYAMAALFRIAPGHEIAACDGLILVCELFCLTMVYRLFLLSCGPPTAVIMTLLAGIAHESFRYSFEIMPEIPFLAGVMALLAGFEAIFHQRNRPRWWDWALFTAGIFVTVNLKPMMLPLLAICLAVLPWRRRQTESVRRSRFAALIILTVVLLFFCYDPRHPFSNAGTSSYEQLALREAERFPERWRVVTARELTDLLGSSVARSVIGVPTGITALNGMIGIAVIGMGLVMLRYRPLWGAWLAVVIAKLVFLYSHDRYLVPILPLLIFAWWRIICWLCARLPKHWGNYAFALLLASSLIPNAVKAASTIIDQHRHPFLAYYHGGRSLAMEQIGRELNARAASDELILSSVGTSHVLTFLSGRNVYEPPARCAASSDRVLLVVPMDVPDDEFVKWVDDLKLVREEAPLYEYVCPLSQGGSFAIFAARAASDKIALSNK